MRSSFRRIGDYVQQANTRNVGLIVTNLQGVSINKLFMPSVANINGTDLSTYKVVAKGQFAFNPMHVGRDEVLPIAMLDTDDPVIVSPAYVVFEIIDKQALLPEYLMMWCRRPEFDRNASFTTDSSVRGGFNWNDFCDMMLPIPSLEKQREIVKEYHTIVDRIKLNERLNQKLEETAQSIYKLWFVDFEFPLSVQYATAIGKPELEGQPYKSSGGEMVYNDVLKQEIPNGWEVQSVGCFCTEMKNGGTPNRAEPTYWDSCDIPWLKTGEISNNIVVKAEEYISKKGYASSSAKLLPKDTVLMALYGVTAGQIGYLKFESTTNQACCAMICSSLDEAAFLYYFLLFNQDSIANMANGGAQSNLSKTIVEELPILVPKNGIHHRAPLKELLDSRERATREIVSLTEMADLILRRISIVGSYKS